MRYDPENQIRARVPLGSFDDKAQKRVLAALIGTERDNAVSTPTDVTLAHILNRLDEHPSEPQPLLKNPDEFEIL